MKKPIQTGGVSPDGKVLALLKDQLNLAMGINRTSLLILVERWVIKTNNGLIDDSVSHTKNNILRRLQDEELTFKKFIEYLDIVGYSECEIIFKGKHKSGKLFTASESFMFVDGNPVSKESAGKAEDTTIVTDLSIEFVGKHNSGKEFTGNTSDREHKEIKPEDLLKEIKDTLLEKEHEN